MDSAGAILNLILGACALSYSWLPPERVRNYRPELAQLLRWLGAVLIALAAVSLVLQAVRGRAS